ncbi:50S ribosomal protein L6 [Candidatus Poribacteria bacterium]|nr:50S ribosomal protein L6 [Candidatus Poribacteria bacterium]
MSRIGKAPIQMPAGVQVSVTPTEVSVKGPKGTLKVKTHGRVEVKADGGIVTVERFDNQQQSRAYHGLYQRMIANCIAGVTAGFKKELEIQGVGYRASMDGKTLVLALGYSHPIRFAPPAGITISVPKQTEIIIEGIDKQQVGQVAADIRGFRPPEPYKGKGVRYAGEYVAHKVGKASGK